MEHRPGRGLAVSDGARDRDTNALAPVIRQTGSSSAFGVKTTHLISYGCCLRLDPAPMVFPDGGNSSQLTRLAYGTPPEQPSSSIAPDAEAMAIPLKPDSGQTTSIDNPILNSPYEQPDRHYEVGPNGPTGEIKDGRRPSESFIPIAVAKKGKKGEPVQETIDFDVTGERRERNTLINDIRRDVEKWRRDGQLRRRHADHPQAAPALGRPGPREPRPLRPARGGRDGDLPHRGRRPAPGYADWRKRLEPENEAHNDGLPRVALKMATGSGKTVVMAMLIAWQTLNKVQSPRDARFANRFLVVTPGHHDPRPAPRPAARGRRELLRPARPRPADLKGGLEQRADRDHQLPRLPAQGRQGDQGRREEHPQLLLKGDRKDDPFKETPQAMVEPRPARPRRRTSSEIVVLNDEAHHCYQDKPLAGRREGATRSSRTRTSEARVWFRGLQAIAKHVGHQADLRPVGDAVLPARAPATTRATSSRGRSATSR